MDMDMKLGLDASTNCTGYCIVNNNEIMLAGFIDTSKCDTIRDTVAKVLEDLPNDVSFCKKIIVEQSLSGFAGGKTSQQTIMKLAQFNAVLCYVLEDTFMEAKISTVNAMTARKQLFGKARVKGMTGKEFVREELEKKFDLTKFIKINRIGNWDKKNEDMYDACVCAFYN